MMTPMENVAVVLIALVLQFAKKSKEPPAGDPEPFDKLYLKSTTWHAKKMDGLFFIRVFLNEKYICTSQTYSKTPQKDGFRCFSVKSQI